MEEIKKMMDKMNNDFGKYMTEELSNLKPDIDPDPSLILIKELLGEVPGQIERIREKAINVKKFLMDYKMMIKSMKTDLELEKSKIRKEAVEEYQNQIKVFIKEAKELVNDVSDGNKKLPTAIVQEMIKIIKPEKPTQSFLDDLANIKTQEKQERIIKCEMQVNEIEEIHAKLENMANKYENKNLAVRAHKTLKENEMKYNLSQN